MVYDLAYDCNRWTAEALASGGLPIKAQGVVFAGQIMGQVRQLAAKNPRPATVLSASGDMFLNS